MLQLRLQARYLCVQECFELLKPYGQALHIQRLSKVLDLSFECSIFVFCLWVLLFRASWLAFHRICSGSGVITGLH